MTAGKGRCTALLTAAAMGLLTFFALESAIARRVGLDLLLPVSGGVFLPGRLGRLAACLVLGFALALTDRGQKLLARADRLCRRDRGRWAVSAAVTALFFLWTLRVTVLSYMTMDEMTLLQHISQVPEKGLAAVHNTLSQTVTERSSPFSVLLCLFIGQFYRLDGDGYWYLLYQMAVLFVSFTVIGRCVLVKTCRRGWPVWAGCLVYGLLGAGVLYYPLSRIAFTVTAAVNATAAVALILCRRQESTHAGRVRCDILSAALMVLCCLLRRATGYSLLCFWALAMAYEALRNILAGKKELKKRLGALALTAVITLALIGGVFAAVPLECDEQYQQAEYYRSLVGDYLKDTLTFDQYARAGVSQELASMIFAWCYMDRRVTTDLFRQVADVYYADQAAQPAQPLPARLLSTAKELASTLWEDPQMLWQTAVIAVLAVGCFGRRYWPEMLCALCAAGGALLMLLYLVRDGRFPIRAFLVISIPAAVVLLLLALSGPDGADAVTVRPAARIFAAACAVGFALLCTVSLHAGPHAAAADTRDEVFALQDAMEAYARQHSDWTIISSVYDRHDANTDPLRPLSAYPDNLCQWGYCGDLAKDPDERLYADAFFRDDVVLVADRPSSVINLLQYLSVEYGPVQAAVETRLPAGTNVYRIQHVAPDQPDYTGWYEQNGLTYYFRDGQALTGRQTIDGESYEFAPIGSQSAMSVPPGDTRIFTLDAFALVQ